VFDGVTSTAQATVPETYWFHSNALSYSEIAFPDLPPIAGCHDGEHPYFPYTIQANFNTDAEFSVSWRSLSNFLPADIPDHLPTHN
jgi:hypothetical protein